MVNIAVMNTFFMGDGLNGLQSNLSEYIIHQIYIIKFVKINGNEINFFLNIKCSSQRLNFLL